MNYEALKSKKQPSRLHANLFFKNKLPLEKVFKKHSQWLALLRYCHTNGIDGLVLESDHRQWAIITVEKEVVRYTLFDHLGIFGFDVFKKPEDCLDSLFNKGYRTVAPKITFKRCSSIWGVN